MSDREANEIIELDSNQGIGFRSSGTEIEMFLFGMGGYNFTQRMSVDVAIRKAHTLLTLALEARDRSRA